MKWIWVAIFLLVVVVAVIGYLVLGPSPPSIFTVVLLPDTQYYSEDGDGTYEAQADWIVREKRALNIKYVVHMGDLVHTEADTESWDVADAAHDILDGAGVPYTVIPGNHDLRKTTWGRSRVSGNYNDRFGPDRFVGPAFDYYQGGFPSGRNDNNYSFFEAGTLEFMVIGLEDAPSSDAMCWAADLMEANRNRRTIITTHCYQEGGGERHQTCDTRDNLVGANGQVLWDQLLSRYPQIFMVTSGHVAESDRRLRARGNGWWPVHEVVTDYQFDQRDGNRHGNGWLKYLEFDPKKDKIQARVHSVLGKQTFSPRNSSEYSSDPNHDDHTFELDYTMTLAIAGGLDPAPPLEVFSDRRINADATRHQRKPSVARQPTGDFVVVWEDDSEGAEGVYQIYARGFDSNGCQRFAQRTVNTTASGQQLEPVVAADNVGNFVVVWSDDANDNGIYQIKARGFDARGFERIAQFTVNTTSDGQQKRPRVAMDADGDFAVVWEDDANENGVFQIKMRGFTSSGTQRFAQRTVNIVAAGQQRRPDVAMDAHGNFVVVWADDSDDNDVYQIKARGFGETGAQRFAQQSINTVSDGQQRRPRVASNASGDFVVVWEDDSNDNDVFQIKMRGFESSGTQSFSQRTVNQGAAGQQRKPDIAMNQTGDFVVIWEDDLNDNDIFQIKTRGYRRDGTERMPQVTVNRNSNGQQLFPAVSIDEQLRFVAVWQDDLENNEWWEILGRGCHLDHGCSPP